MQHRVLIASPMRSSDPLAAPVCYGYARALRRYARDMSVDVLEPHSFLAPEDMDDIGYGPDMVRVRSRIVRIALESPKAYTSIWWWDCDVILRDPLVPARMLMTGHPIIGAPYPRKAIRWERSAARARELAAAGEPITADELETNAVDYPVKPGGSEPGPDNCVDVPGLGFGFMFTSTDVLRTMWERYEDTLSFGDVFFGKAHPTVALFNLLLPKDRGEGPESTLDSEDYSFCYRARECGFKVQMYLGPGSPLDHAGSHVFRGIVGKSPTVEG